MALPHSPRLPGVKVLASDATGPEYSRWRRGIQTAFEAKGTWGHCDGSNPMPMPERGSTFFSPSLTLQPQVELLDERRAWVKKDRDVKLDLFLSVADDVKFEVFDVGPPLPPSSLNAKEMLDVLDEHFAVFKFEDYHHAFCHFLNLHIDQYPSLEDFNAEFLATLEDLLDHGQSLTNIQACSAYFSKLRCTQNPWVVKKLEEWDAQTSEPQLTNLMKEASSWFNVRPLTTRGSQHSFPTSIPEEDLVELPALSDGEETEVAELAGSMSDSSHSRQSSRSTTRSQEITIAASTEDLSEVAAFPDLYSLTPQKSVPKISLSPVPMIERPLPPLPPGVKGLEIDMRPLKPATSPSPKPRAQQHVAEQLQHPALRSRTPPQPSKPSAKAGTVDHSPITLPSSRFSWGTNTTKTSDSQPRTPRHPPHARTTSSSTTASSFRQPRPKTPSPPQTQTAFPISTPPSKMIPPAELPTADRPHTSHSTKDSNPLLSRPGFTRTKSTSSSVISLPLQGTITPDIDYRDARLKDASYRDVSPISSGSRSRSPPFIRRGTAGSDTIDEERKKMGKKGWNVKAVFNRVN